MSNEKKPHAGKRQSSPKGKTSRADSRPSKRDEAATAFSAKGRSTHKSGPAKGRGASASAPVSGKAQSIASKGHSNRATSTRGKPKPAPAETATAVTTAGSGSDEKLQKVLARAGIGSRREMERVIAEGRVRVNDAIARLGDRVELNDKVVVDGKPVKLQEVEGFRRRVLLYNKPEGEICSRNDPEGRRTVYERLPRLSGERWISVGRLDFNTSGLLLFTNDGELANKLMHPSSVIDREYLVRIQGDVDEEMKARLRKGVMLDDGIAKFTDVVDGAGDGRNRWFYCVVMEGRNREVRRLWESQGVKVSRLKRVRYGNIFIPSHVRVGQWLELGDREFHDLCLTAGLETKPNAPLSREEEVQIERHQRKLRSGKGRRPQ